MTNLEIDGNFRSIKDGIASILDGSTTLTSTPFIGTPTAPTAVVGTSSTQLATTEYVVAQIAADAPSKTGVGASGTWAISVSGNAATVTNGVVLTGSYSNPSWITSLAASKLTGTIVATNGVVTTGSYADPAWITSLATSKLTGDIVATNGVVTTGSYVNPSWLVSIDSSKITGTIGTPNAVLTTETYANPSWITSLAETKVLPLQLGNSGKALVTNGTSTSWQSVGASISNDTTTDVIQYPTMTRLTSGNFETSYVASTKLYFNPLSGILNATSLNSLSDQNAKTNVVDIKNALGTVKEMRGVEYDWIDNGKKSAGVIAQELERILPHLVDTNQDGIKSVNYAGLTAYLIESIKTLSDRVEQLENK